MTLLAIDDYHYVRWGDPGTACGVTELFCGKHDRWYHPAKITTLECSFHWNKAKRISYRTDSVSINCHNVSCLIFKKISAIDATHPKMLCSSKLLHGYTQNEEMQENQTEATIEMFMYIETIQNNPTNKNLASDWKPVLFLNDPLLWYITCFNWFTL